MATPSTFSLNITFNATIETPPSASREQFRQSAILTLLSVVKKHDVSVEYIGYKADPIGIHHLDSPATEYEDSVFASLVIHHNPYVLVESRSNTDHLVKEFVETFESKTHRHLEVELAREDAQTHDVEIEMNSDWTLYLKQD
ncbi:hypothetical protein [Flavobacterium selenitireducens]|uniref:hypothetical protein n=1 Tax=Flavobacterium selenitireducens TaxID=2722704 RepID=UPI00168B93C5|nr:hypothetical protein [Flavobacterium selenitireducens]MBD3581123.1 hypothetical protein [Flavobacterium selenitireducens]